MTFKSIDLNFGFDSEELVKVKLVKLHLSKIIVIFDKLQLWKYKKKLFIYLLVTCIII
jgi:hypothetical protein